jgi:drug/metabolite transporter (DMT)-like permease
VSQATAETSTGRSGERWANVALPLVVVSWGLGPPFTKLITAPPLAAVTVRFWLSVLAMLALTYGSGRHPGMRLLVRAAPTGLLFGLNNLAFFFAVQHASIAVVSVVFALQPAVVLVVAGRALGERPTSWHLAWTVVGIAGAILVIAGPSSGVHTSTLGVLLACLSMAALSAYHVINRAVRSGGPVDPVEWMLGATLFAALGITPVALIASRPPDYGEISTADLGYIAFVAIVVGVVGHTTMSWVHKYVPAGRSALYLLSFNVVAVVVAWFVNSQPLTSIQILGGLVVLLSAGAVALRKPGDVVVEELGAGPAP